MELTIEQHKKGVLNVSSGSGTDHIAIVSSESGTTIIRYILTRVISSNYIARQN